MTLRIVHFYFFRFRVIYIKLYGHARLSLVNLSVLLLPHFLSGSENLFYKRLLNIKKKSELRFYVI